MPPAIQATIERSLQVDLSAVRVHTDSQAQNLAKNLSARAVTYGNHIFLGRGERATDLDLMAHEAAHVVQQRGAPMVQQWSSGRSHDRYEREAHQAAAATLHHGSFTVSERTSSPRAQRLGLSDILDGLANLAANLPGYTLLTVIIGRNPINMRVVERNFTNLLRGFMGLIPGGEILFQVLNGYGVVERIGNWVSAQVNALGLSFDYMRGLFNTFTDSLSWRDIFSPGDVWRRARNIFSEPINRITGFISRLISQAITWLKETFMPPLSNFCREIPGYTLVTVLLGKDPFTNVAVPRTALNVVRAFAEFIPGGTEKVNQLVESRALERAYAWFTQETQARNLTWARVTGTFAQAWNSLRLEDVLHPIDTLRRIVNMFSPLMRDLVGFAGAALMQLLEFIFEAVMGAAGARILAIFKRARETFLTIIREPVRFLRNLLGAVSQGVRQFMNNILRHLRDGVIAWLTGPVAAAGIQIPEQWDLRGIIWFVMQILGLTWTRIRQKLVRLMGEPNVARLEAVFQLIQEIREKGLVQALRDRVTEFFGQLRDAALGSIRSFIQERIVMAGIEQLLSMLIPVAAIIQAIRKVYTTIQFFIQRINQILDLVESIVNSIAAIASGAIGAAANFVERTMARTIPIILDFLARFIGLGDVGGHVQRTIRSLQARVDQMLDRAVDWIKRQAQNLLSRALGGDPNAPPEQRLRQAVAEGKQAVNRYAGQRVGALVLRPLLTAIRLRHRLTSLDVIERGENWAVRGVINPIYEDGTNVKVVAVGNVTDWPTGTSSDPIPIKWFKPHSGFYPTIRIRGGAEKTPRQGITLPTIEQTPERKLQVSGSNFLARDTKITRKDRGSENVKEQYRRHLDKLLALSPNHADRIFFDGSDNYAVDHVRDLTWSGNDHDDNLWPLASAKNNAINASHNQRVRVNVGSTEPRTAAVSQFPDKTFIIKKVATTAPSSAGDHGSDNEHPINSGLGDIPKKI